MSRKARCTGIVRDAVLCPYAKDTCSCYTLTVRLHVLSITAQTSVSDPDGRSQPRQEGSLALLVCLYCHCHLPFLRAYVNLKREINHCSRPRTIRSEGVQRAGSSPRVIVGALLACNVPDACRATSACNVGLLSVTSCAATLFGKAALQ